MYLCIIVYAFLIFSNVFFYALIFTKGWKVIANFRWWWFFYAKTSAHIVLFSRLSFWLFDILHVFLIICVNVSLCSIEVYQCSMPDVLIYFIRFLFWGHHWIMKMYSYLTLHQKYFSSADATLPFKKEPKLWMLSSI